MGREGIVIEVPKNQRRLMAAGCNAAVAKAVQWWAAARPPSDHGVDGEKMQGGVP